MAMLERATLELARTMARTTGKEQKSSHPFHRGTEQQN
jgi:hypothetical protein